MKKSFILYIFLSLILLSSCSFEKIFTEGKGTIDDPYLISSAEQLNNIRNHMDKHFKQVNDIDLSVYDNWEPLGKIIEIDNSKNIAFTGTYDGNNYSISNLNIFRSEEEFIGFFRALDKKAIVKNVRLENANIAGYNRVGGIAGFVNEGTIENSYVRGKVQGEIRVGGITGSFSDKAKLQNSTSEIEIKGTERVGGLIGINFGEIIDSHSKGIVTFLDSTNSENNNFIGGVTGDNYGKIINSSFDGKIYGNDFIGGITGKNKEIIENSFSFGVVSGNSEVGGITGFNTYSAEIRECSSENIVSGNKCVGGLVGSNEGIIIESKSLGSVSGNFYLGKYIGLNSFTGNVDFKNDLDNITENKIGLDFRYEPQEMTLTEKLLKYSHLWGLKGEVKNHVSNDIEIDWYEDQFETGEYGNINCVPTAAAMAVNWYNKEIITNGEEIRNLYLEKKNIDGLWYFQNLTDFLKENDIEFFIDNIKFNIINKLKEQIDKGNIIILGGVMEEISVSLTSFEKTGIFYNATIIEELHAFIIKGYVETDEKLYFEIYDPISGKMKCFDGMPRGKNRYFLSEEIENLIINRNSWPVVFIKNMILFDLF